MEYPKTKRVVDKELLDTVMRKQKYCIVGKYGQYGGCYGEECPHHIKSRGSGGGDIAGNIIRVCLRHHQMIHNGIIPRDRLYVYLEDL